MLDPKFKITNEITRALTEIERARGFLEASHFSAGWVNNLQEELLLKEAYHTTHIEGTQLTLKQSEQIWEGQYLKEVDKNDVRELLNYRTAFELVSKHIDSGMPVTEAVIREIHKSLVENVRGNSAAPGEYRKIQNYVVNSTTQEVIYEPPPAFEVSRLMQEMVDWINGNTAVHPVLMAGVAQFQLVHVHPFLDGNGRTARLLSTLCLYRKGYDFKRLFSISEYYDRNRAEYYQAIQGVRENNMDMTGWLEYFTLGLSTQLQEFKKIKAESVLPNVRLTKRQKVIVNYITEHMQLNINQLEELCSDVTRRTLQRELRDLLDKGVLEAEGSTNNRAYRLKDLL